MSTCIENVAVQRKKRFFLVVSKIILNSLVDSEKVCIFAKSLVRLNTNNIITKKQ